MNINKLIQITHKIIKLKIKSTTEKVQTYVKSSQQNRVRPLGWFLRSLPELFLRGISIHGTDPEQAVAELFRNVGQVTRLRTDHTALVDQAQGGEEARDLALGEQGDDVAHVEKAGAAQNLAHGDQWDATSSQIPSSL